MVQLDLSSEKNAASLALIYGIIMFKRCHEISRLQRLNTVLFSEGNASKEVIEFTWKRSLPAENYKSSIFFTYHNSISLDLVIKLIKKTNATRFILTTYRHRPMSSSGNEF